MRKTDKICQQGYGMFVLVCRKLRTDRNAHEGIAVFMIAKLLTKTFWGMKYAMGEKIALNYLARREDL